MRQALFTMVLLGEIVLQVLGQIVPKADMSQIRKNGHPAVTPRPPSLPALRRLFSRGFPETHH